MGLYQTDYLFQGTFPFIIPKFVIFIMYYEVVDKITSDILLRCTCLAIALKNRSLKFLFSGRTYQINKRIQKLLMMRKI